MIVVLWSLAFPITIAAACRTHFAANWKSLLILEEDCIDIFRLLLTYTITDVVVDLGILLVPIPMVRIKLFSDTSRGSSKDKI